MSPTPRHLELALFDIEELTRLDVAKSLEKQSEAPNCGGSDPHILVTRLLFQRKEAKSRKEIIRIHVELAA